MKKSWKRILAVAAILVLALCVLSGCSDNTQAKIDEAVNSAKEALIKEKDEALAAAQTAADEALKSAQDAADAAKAELEGQVADLTGKLTAAEEAAKTAAETALKEKDEALAAAQTAADEALKTAQDAADAAKAELEGQVADLTGKLTAAEEAAKTAAETAKAELDSQVADLTGKLTAAEEAAKTAADAAAAEKAELEGKVATLEKTVEEVTAAAAKDADAAVKTAQEAAEAAKTELEGKVSELTKKLEEAEAAAKTAAEAAAKEKDEAVAAAVKAGEDAKAELEAQVKELTEKLTAAEEAAKAPAEEPAAEEKKEEEPAAEGEAEVSVMSYEDYVAAELDSEVCVETYVQATQSWWDNKITVYAQTGHGGYFIYNMECSEEDSAKLVPGTKIRVRGFKSEWAGEVEITDAAFEILEGDSFIAEPEDVTALLGKDELKDHQNEKVLFKGLTVAAQDDGEAINYKNATEKTDDIYVRFTDAEGQVFNFCVEFYLTGKDTDVYKAVEGLQIGDVVDVEGFLYWYEGPNAHITGVTKAE